MPNKNKDRGDRAEREAAKLLTDLTGFQCRRKLGAGRQDDTGDIDGLPETTVQVASWKDTSAAAIQKPRGAEEQRINAGTPFTVTMVRFKGGNWRMIQTPEQFAALLKAALTHSFCKP